MSFGIVRRHNGSIEVDSDLGRGTTFRISLPKVEPVLTTVVPNIIAEAENASGERKTRVLVVDDETPVRNVLIEALEAEGCEVFAAQDGVVALEIYDRYRGQIDIVFTDIGMPEMNGWELVTALRQRSNTVPVAIVSGWADAMGHEKRKTLKADWIVAKPFDIEIISKIARDIGQRRLTQVN